MHAMVLKKIGTALEWTDLPDRQPGAGQIRVKVAACGVAPIIPGHEIVGLIDAVGETIRGRGCSRAMSNFMQKSFREREANDRALRVIALENAARKTVGLLQIGDAGTMERRAMERWENEWGEIPGEQRKKLHLVKGKSTRPGPIPLFFQSN